MSKIKGKVGSREFTEAFFRSNKEYHYNFEERAEDYLVSSGSMILDKVIGGGFGAGLHRFIGANEGGKTNEALHVMFNMLNSMNDSKGLFVMAEGRLNNDIKKRSGIKFVYDPAEWEIGTCLVFECHVMDTMVDLLRGLIRNNPDREKFCIVIDSMDGLITKEYLEISSSEARKVAGGALMTSDFLKRISLGMSKFGHMCIMVSQGRASININAYAKQDPNNQTNSSGGNAILHYPDWILEFQKQNKSDKILEKPDQQLTPDNKIYGHNAKVLICKSTTETTGQVGKYPIKHGRINGKSIWIEREVVDMLLMWGYIERSGSWFKFEEEVMDYIKEKNLEIKEAHQGSQAIYGSLEKDEKVTAALVEFVKNRILDK